MFNIFKKKEPNITLQKDPFPDYEEIKKITIIDIRDLEDIEYYGKFPNSVHIPFDEYFESRLRLLDKNRKYGIMDLKGIEAILNKAEAAAKRAGLDVKKLKGGFFYISEVLNYKPTKE